MKPVKNEPVIEIFRDFPSDPSHYYCKFCGAEDSGKANYSEVVYGTADLVGIGGGLDNYETDDSDGFEISSYECTECGEQRDDLGDLFTDEEPNIDEEEER